MNVTPLVQWPGGKRKIAAELLDVLDLRSDETLCEPFCGGAALSIEAYNRGHRRFSLNDANRNLRDLYLCCRAAPRHLHDLLQHLAATHTTEASYYETRKRFNEAGFTLFGSAAAFLWLNRAGFNGLYRENKKGEFNVPAGNRIKAGQPLSLPTLEQMQAFQQFAQSVVIDSTDYRNVYLGASPRVVYYDPPYMPLKAGGFTSYVGAKRWNRAAFETFERHASDLGARDVYISMDPRAPGFREVFPEERWEEAWRGTAQRSISRDGAGREKAAEVLLRRVR